MAIQVMLSAVASSGALGASDQYLCLLLLALAAKFEYINLSSEVGFIGSMWFIGIVAVLWVLTVLPAYGTLLAPGVLNFVNTTVGILSGVLVPASGALLAMAMADATAAMHHAANIVPPGGHLCCASGYSGGIGSSLLLVGGGGALLSSLVTFLKFLLKPMLATITGTVGHVNAPIYKTMENVLALILMGLVYVLMSINPWLLVLMAVAIIVAFLVVLAFALYGLWRLGKGVGKVLRILEVNPRVGLAIIIEPFVWGTGWMILKGWQSGIHRLALWGVGGLMILVVVPLILSPIYMIIPPLFFIVPFAQLSLAVACVYLIGFRSARALLKTVDVTGTSPALTPGWSSV